MVAGVGSDRLEGRADNREPGPHENARCDSSLGCDRVGGGLAGLCGLCVAEQCGYDLVYLLLEVGLVQTAVLVEALACVTDGDLAFGYPSVDRAEDLAQLGLRPDGTEHAGTRADHSDRLVAQGVGGEWAREPVERVLERARDRGVVLGGDEEHGVGVPDRLADSRDGLGSFLGVVVLVVGRDVAEPVVDLELRALGLEQVAGVAQERRVVGVAAQTAADTKDPHGATPALTTAARRRSSPRWRGPARRSAAGCSS